MECSTKVFAEGSLGLKAQMNQATACLVLAFDGTSIKSSKKLAGSLVALNAATHGAIAKAVEQGDLESKAGSTLLLTSTDAWSKLGLKAERLLLVSTGDEPKSSKAKASSQGFAKWMQAGLKALTATNAKNAVWVFEDLSVSDGLTQARLLVQLAR